MGNCDAHGRNSRRPISKFLKYSEPFLCLNLQVAPLDFLQADDLLTEEALQLAHKESHMWTAEGWYPLLPRACCVLESVTDSDAGDHAPYSVVLPPVALKTTSRGSVNVSHLYCL